MNNGHKPQTLLDEVLTSAATAMGIPPDELSADTDLFAAGLDSITLMRLIAQWRQQGYRIDFATLAREPHARRWAEHLSANASQAKPASGQSHAPAQSDGHPSAPFPLAPMQYAYWVGRSPSQPAGRGIRPPVHRI